MSPLRFLFYSVVLVLPSLSLVSMTHANTLSMDFEASGQWEANFRTLSGIGTGTAAQTTVSGASFFRHDSTGGSATAAYLFDQTPGDTTASTQSTFTVSGPITVSADVRAAVSNSSISIVFADPANLANNVLAIININSGADQIRFFRDAALMTANVPIGTQVTGTGSSATPSVVEPGGAFTNLSVTLTVSGTDPTLSVTWGDTTSTFALGAGHFDFLNNKTLVAIRVYDPSTGPSPIDLDNVVITSPAAPDNPPGPPEENVAPTLPTQTNRTVAALDTLLVTNTATDTNTPAQTLSYQLLTAPAGASISASGVISWTPTPGQVAVDPYTFTTQVTDSGTPALSATDSFQVTVTEAPAFEFSQTLDFTNASDFTNSFRVLSTIGGGTLGAVDGSFRLDARSAGGSTAGVLLYDATPGDPGTQTAFPTDKQVRVSFLARAATANSTFTVSFADPRNASNRVSATFVLRAGDDTVRFHRDGTLTATTSTDGTQVGSDASFDSGAEPASGLFVPVTVVLTVSATTPTLTVIAGNGTPVASAFAAGDIDWNPTLVLLRFADPSTGLGALEIDNLLVAGGSPVTPPPPTLPPAPGADGNLITVNPSFETGSLNNFSGSYSFTGWIGTNALFSNHAIISGSVAAGTTTHGTKKLLQSWGGTLTTAITARPPATPGTTYELTYDQRALVRNFPNEKLGSTPTIEFFDPVGVRIKSAWNFAGRYRIQDSGKDTWETFTVRAVAPPGTAFVGVFFNHPAGRFASNEENYTQDRHVEMDNVQLKVVPERLDRLAYRRAPRLVEPGRVATLKINHIALAPRILRAALLDAAGVERAAASVTVPAGRFRATPLSVAIPANLPDGTYSWRIQLTPTGSPAAAVATLNLPGVLIDQSVALSPINTADFPANHPRIQWQGRIEDSGNSRIWHWHGSEVRLRFSGTSLTLVGGVIANIYGQHETHSVVAVVNENFSAPITVTFAANGSSQTIPVVTGLPDGIHTVRLYKNLETDRRLRFDLFRVDAGKGLLAYEPLPARRLEVYGDSVTNASSTNFPFNGYSHLLGRELDTDFRNIAKGGTGIASSFVGTNALISNFYNNLTYQNVFNPADGTKYTMSQWTPSIVLFGFGHNDQFNGGGGTPFNTKYAEIKTNIRAAYPGVPIFSYNTVISNNLGHFQNAVDPLIAGDPKHLFGYQPSTWVDSATAHPPTDGHAAMVYGDERRYSLAEVVEDSAGWGLNTPLDDYETWVVNEFSPEEIAAGLHAPQAAVTAEGFPNILRYALGMTGTGDIQRPSVDLDPTGRLTLTFSRARLDVSYVPEVSSDLVTWEPIPVGPGQLDELITVVDDVLPGSKRFIRLRVSRP